MNRNNETQRQQRRHRDAHSDGRGSTIDSAPQPTPRSAGPGMGIWPEDRKRALRFTRALLAAGGAGFFTIICIVLYFVGVMRVDWIGLTLMLSIFWIINIGFLAAIRLGFSEQFADPSLTLVQIIWSITSVMVTVYFLNDFRTLVLMLVSLAMIFGCFRLRLTEFLFATTYAVCGYAAAILLLAQFHPQVVNPTYEVINWATLVLVLLGFCFVGSEIAKLRRSLRDHNIQLRKKNIAMKNIASTDELTGVYNRRQILKMTSQQMAYADRGDYTFCLVIADLDYFKRVNDHYGHAVGDVGIKAFTSLADRVLRRFDSVGRLGGEEFILVIAGSSLRRGVRVAERFRAAFAASLITPEVPELRLTASFGVANYIPGESVEELLSRADQALYEAKDLGRNKVVPEPRSLKPIKNDEKLAANM